MGRSYDQDDHSDDRDRRRARKHLKKHNRSTKKSDMKKYTSSNLSEEDYLDFEEDKYGKSKS